MINAIKIAPITNKRNFLTRFSDLTNSSTTKSTEAIYKNVPIL